MNFVAKFQTFCRPLEVTNFGRHFMIKTKQCIKRFINHDPNQSIILGDEPEVNANVAPRLSMTCVAAAKLPRPMALAGQRAWLKFLFKHRCSKESNLGSDLRFGAIPIPNSRN